MLNTEATNPQQSDSCKCHMQDNGQRRFSVADLQAQLEPLLNGLFGAFKMPESGENDKVMKCVLGLITFVGPQVRKPSPDPESCPDCPDPIVHLTGVCV